MDDCLRTALLQNEPEGIWGGMTANERANFKRRLRRDGLWPEGRPNQHSSDGV